MAIEEMERNVARFLAVASLGQLEVLLRALSVELLSRGVWGSTECADIAHEMHRLRRVTKSEEDRTAFLG